MKRIFTLAVLFSFIAFGAASLSFAQTKTRKPIKKPVVKKTQTATVQPDTEQKQPIQSEETPIVDTKTPAKKNERPEPSETPSSQEPAKKNQHPTKSTSGNKSQSEKAQNVFTYEFSQPNFIVNRVVIEHDENGKGTITFEKKNFGDPVTDPIQLSDVSLERIKNLFQTLNFLESTEEYQSTIRQYSHLGTMKIRMKKDEKEREVTYNWTENKDAKALSDEYRKIGQQFIWIFDITIARENQPLQAPSVMDELDSLIRRNEISDPDQMLPMLKKLVDDERIPLIARNHATRIVKEIEKKPKQ